MLKFWKKNPAPDAAEAAAAQPAPHASAAQPAPQAPADAELAPTPRTESASAPAVPAAPPTPEAEPRRSWLDRLKTGLKKTSSSLTNLFVRVKVDEALFEELEDALLLADAGIEATQWLLTELRARARSQRIEDGAQLKTELAGLVTALLAPLQKTMPLTRPDGNKPLVMLIAGVNGAGKTTSIGKLARHFQSGGKRVLLAAGDTFRAAAREQLMIWGERNGVQVIAQEGGDPAAVIFDAVSSARARGFDLMMADTAGRLPTQLHLMEELKKIRRVIAKAEDGAPHEVLLVIDGNTGQNAVAQVRAFNEALGLTGLIVTKLDGTAKGGVLCAIARTCPVPVYFIGVGEGLEDLQPFDATEFTAALLG